HLLADRQPRHGIDVGQRDDDRRRARRLDVETYPIRAAVEDVGHEPDDRAVDGRVDVRAGGGADVDSAGFGSLAAAQLVPDRSTAAAAEQPVAEPREQTLVALPSNRNERESSVAGAVEADRGHPAGLDRKLDA